MRLKKAKLNDRAMRAAIAFLLLTPPPPQSAGAFALVLATVCLVAAFARRLFWLVP